MTNCFPFTFLSLEEQLEVALDTGYKFLTCAQYASEKPAPADLAVVLRVDIDTSCTKAKILAEIFARQGVKASFFVRLHAKEYNPFSFENYRILKAILNSGHEIGYHSEIIDQSVIWSESAADCLRRDVDVLNRMLDIQIRGVASHGGMTGLNNLDFWRDRSAREFGLLYEAYEQSNEFSLFTESFYVSDSEWTRWKCYEKGKLVEGDRRNFGEHAKERHPLIYLLIHPDTYYERHIYE